MLSHRMDDGSEKPIAFAFRSLAPAERIYAQLDKEGLAIVFSVKNSTTISLGVTSRSCQITSHYSICLVSPIRLAFARIQRWALTLRPTTTPSLISLETLMPMQMAEKYMTTIKEPFQYVLFYDHCLFFVFLYRCFPCQITGKERWSAS